MKNGLCGNIWLPLCKQCHLIVEECCIDVELSLFPDEITPFIEKDPNGVTEYEDGTYSYEKKGACCFLTAEKACQLQLNDVTKPVDCLIYPINYKNGKIFLDSSCWAKDLVSEKEAILHLKKKLARFPQYRKIKYEIRESDQFIMLLPVE